MSGGGGGGHLSCAPCPGSQRLSTSVKQAENDFNISHFTNQTITDKIEHLSLYYSRLTE